MADFADQAAAAADEYLRAALAGIGSPVGGDGEVFECVECGEEIPEARRKAVPGCIYCVTCQKMVENQGG